MTALAVRLGNLKRKRESVLAANGTNERTKKKDKNYKRLLLVFFFFFSQAERTVQTRRRVLIQSDLGYLLVVVVVDEVEWGVRWLLLSFVVDGLTKERNASMIRCGWRLLALNQWLVFDTAEAFERMNEKTWCFNEASLAWSLTSSISMALSIFNISNIVDLARSRNSFRLYFTAARKRSIGLRRSVCSSVVNGKRPV